MTKNMVKGVEDTILTLFEELSNKYHYYDETSKNIHYYNGWKTNKAYIINKRVIIPLRAWDDIFGKMDYSYTVKNKLSDIEKVFNLHGFKKQQGSMYFGSPESTAVDCTLAIMDITSAYDWFAQSVSDVRMLRVEDNNDLKPIIEKVSSMKK